jgi:hypothetical protein
MKTNKIDKSIKEKFENRTFTPSASAWERLSVQLDEQPKQKKLGRFFYIGIAASILLLVSIGIQFFSNDSEKVLPKDEIVILPSDKKEIDLKIDKLINEIPVPEAVVKNEEIEIKKEIVHSPVIANNQKQTFKKKKTNQKNKYKSIIASIDKTKNNSTLNKVEKVKIEFSSKKITKQDQNSTIKVNADDLLYAVTHTPKEVKKYYAKYNIDREDVLKTIRNELKKSNIKVNPNTILAEVERTIDDEFFENTFMKSLKRRVSDIAVAIASRND